MRTRKKLAIATWSAPREPNIYGKLTVDVTKALAYLAELREASGVRVTMTHLVGKAIARGLEATPDLNGRIVFGRFVPFETLDLAFLVALDGGDDLAKAKISNIDRKSVIDIARELDEMAVSLRAGQDEAFNQSKQLLRVMPVWAIRWLVRATGFATGGLGIDASKMGLEPFPFGTCIITSMGSLGVDEGWAPPTPFARVPLYVLVGAVRKGPAVKDGEVVATDQMTLCATIDHRFIDGHHGAGVARVTRAVLEDPYEHLGAPR